MSTRSASPTTVKSGADITFPKYHPKATRMERLFGLKRMHHKALAEVEDIVKKSAVHDYDRTLKLLADDEISDRSYDYGDTHERIAVEQYARLMHILDDLETETLLFITASYNGTVTDTYQDLITSALAPVYLKDAVASGEDINLIVKNVISYRNSAVNWNSRDIKAFNDVRYSAPELNRADLYNLTGDDREWAIRIFKVSDYSQHVVYGFDKEASAADKSPHMNHELATILREGYEWEHRTKGLIAARKMRASEITADLLRDIHTTGTTALNDGVL